MKPVNKSSMKKIIICCIFVVLAFGSCRPPLNNRTDDTTPQVQSVTDNKSTPDTTTQAPGENKIARELISHKYIWYEDGDAAYISFSPGSDPSQGGVTITSIIRVMEFRLEGDRNAIDVVTNPNVHAVFEYTYVINHNHLNLTFVKSNVNYTGSDKTLSYDERTKTLTAYTNEGEMIFKP
jgi:uncharacterized protein YxeA